MKEKLIINTALLRKESEFRTKTCMVEKAIAVPHAEFEKLKRHPLQDNDLISENTGMMYCDSDETYHCLLIYDKDQGDGLLIESEGSAYARYSQYIPKAKELVEKHQNSEIKLTNGEKKLHELLNETADRIAIFARLSYCEFSLDDVLQDLDCDFDDVKKMLVEAAAEILNDRNDIRSVRINDIDIPFQPDITVESEEPKMKSLMKGKAMIYDQKTVETLRQRYPEGTRICLDSMENDPRPIPSGTKGKVMFVDDAGTLHCQFENGRALGVIPGEDSFHKVQEQTEDLSEEPEMKMSM